MRKSKAISACLPALILRDYREKQGHGWLFADDNIFGGTEVATLKTGDYTIKGFENLLCIERKGSVTEFVGNLISENFIAELERMRAIKHNYVILEFPFADLVKWPASATMRNKRVLPLKYGAAVTKYTELMLEYSHVHFLFADNNGKAMATTLFKRTIEKYAKDLYQG